MYLRNFHFKSKQQESVDLDTKPLIYSAMNLISLLEFFNFEKRSCLQWEVSQTHTQFLDLRFQT